MPTDSKHSSLSTDSTVCSIRISNDVLFLSETVFHCFLNSQVDFECWLRPLDVPGPATVIKMVSWNKSDIPRVAGKKASKKFPPECHKSSYALFDSLWSIHRATGVLPVLWLTYRRTVFHSHVSQNIYLKILENYVNACASKRQTKTNKKQVDESQIKDSGIWYPNPTFRCKCDVSSLLHKFWLKTWDTIWAKATKDKTG